MNDKDGILIVKGGKIRKKKQVRSLLGVDLWCNPMTEGMNYKLNLISNSKN